MYGMIHRAMRELVIERKGQAAWELIVLDAGLSPCTWSAPWSTPMLSPCGSWGR